MKLTILRFDSIESTNTEALRQAKMGADEGLCIVARQQTGGRGRHGRTWISEKNAGLYFSIVLRPKVEPRFWSLLTLMSAVVVHDVLEEFYKLDADIKWVNDVHVNDRKICGILAETIESAGKTAVIVGIGINLRPSNFPPELKNQVTSIEGEMRTIVETETLLERLTAKFARLYEIFSGENGAALIRDEWTRRSTYANGKPVSVTLADKTITGITCGIEENGALRVREENGAITVVHAGDVERLRTVRAE